MFEKLVALSLRERLIVYFSTGLLAAAGLYAFTQLPIEAYPDLTNVTVQVITQWPGKSAEELEKFVTIPVETAMNGIPHLAGIRSVSLFGLSVVTMTFDDNADDFFARTKVSEKVQEVTFPDGVNTGLSPESGPTGEIYRYSLQSDSLKVMDLKTLQDWVLERQFKSVPGVVEVVSFGGPTKQYEVVVDPGKLAYYGVSLAQVSDALRQNNANAGGSIIGQGDQGFVFRGIGLLSSVEDISSVLLSSNRGAPIRVSQVAEVRIGHAVRLGKVGRQDDDDVVEGIVLMRRGENASAAIEKVHEKVEELNGHILPRGTRIVPYLDRSELIGVTTHTVLHNLMMGMILVVVVLVAFLGNVRSALIAALVVPLALLIAFILMWMRGMSANLLSLGAIDFGVIIDGAVIMIESIFARLAARGVTEEEERIGIIRRTAAEMSKPIVFSIIIIIAAMLPIFSFERIEGRMFSPLAYTLGFTLLGALCLTLTLVPVMAASILKGSLKEKSVLLEYLHRYYDRFLVWCLRNDRPIAAGSVVLLLASLLSARYLGSEFLPHLNEGSLWVRATMPMSVSPAMADSTARRIRSSLMRFDEVRTVVSQLGRPDDGTDATGFFNAEFFLDLRPEAEWRGHHDKESLIADMSGVLERMPGIDFNFSQPIADNVEEAVTGVKGELAVKVYGENLSFLEEKAEQIRDVIAGVRGIADVGIFREIGQPMLQVAVDRVQAARYGVNVSDIQTLIESSINGKVATQLYEGEKHFDVVVRIAEPFRDEVRKIGALQVAAAGGQKVPLSLVSETTLRPGAAFIYREQNSRYIAIKFSVRGRDMGGAVAEAQAAVARQVKLPAGYVTAWGGEFENQQRAMKRLAVVVPLSLLLILMLLYWSFDSWTYALLNLANVPFVTIGGIAGLLVTGLHFSVSAGIGFIALFGVSVMNGTVLLAFIKNNRNLYPDTVELLKAAGKDRVRPIVMVALLAMIGLMPAALSTGIGSEVQKPLAVVIVFGLVFTALTNLVILPVMVKLINPKE